jgi:hypothetical protein
MDMRGRMLRAAFRVLVPAAGGGEGGEGGEEGGPTVVTAW